MRAAAPLDMRPPPGNITICWSKRKEHRFYPPPPNTPPGRAAAGPLAVDAAAVDAAGEVAPPGPLRGPTWEASDGKTI